MVSHTTTRNQFKIKKKFCFSFSFLFTQKRKKVVCMCKNSHCKKTNFNNTLLRQLTLLFEFFSHTRYLDVKYKQEINKIWQNWTFYTCKKNKKKTHTVKGMVFVLTLLLF